MDVTIMGILLDKLLVEIKQITGIPLKINWGVM